MSELFCDLKNGQRLCYRTYGGGTPILLIAGLGLHLTYWPDMFINGLVEQGFQVVTFDNRDVGKSGSALTPPPGRMNLLFQKIPDYNYDLSDMAEDAAGLMDHLEIPKAHTLGISMGGMIAQMLSAKYPDRILTMTSIFSTTGARDVGQPSFATKLRMMRGPAQSRAEFADRFVDAMEHVGGRVYKVDKQALHDYALSAWDRSDSDFYHGRSRQIAAIMKSGDRTEELRKIKAPSLVIHGDRDPLVHPSGGEATAKAIPNARHITINGMGHDIAPCLVPKLLDIITGHLGEKV